jgi:hypothetical protein
VADGESLDESNTIPTVPEPLELDRESRKTMRTNTRRDYGRKHERKNGCERDEFSLMGSNSNGIHGYRQKRTV